MLLPEMLKAAGRASRSWQDYWTSKSDYSRSYSERMGT